MIRVAICDDDARDCSLARSMLERCANESERVTLDIATYDNPVDLLTEIGAGRTYDILLLDIYMPGLLGTEAAQELRDEDSTVHIIFLTSSAEHAYEAFGLKADGYLLKPYSYEDYQKIVQPLFETIARERRAVVFVKAKTGLQRIDYDDFVYSETSNHDQIIHLKSGATLATRQTSTALFECVKQDKRFFKAGSSYILNIDNITALSDKRATFVNGETVNVPTRSWKALEDAFFTQAFEGF